jgi:hypothetical protein
MIQDLWEVCVLKQKKQLSIKHIPKCTYGGCVVRAAAEGNFNTLHVTAQPDGSTPTCVINSQFAIKSKGKENGQGCGLAYDYYYSPSDTTSQYYPSHPQHTHTHSPRTCLPLNLCQVFLNLVIFFHNH